MSISSLSSTIDRLHREIGDLHTQISRETTNEVTKLKKVEQLSKDASRATSISSATSKLQELSRVQKEIGDIQKKKGTLNKNLGDKEQQLIKAQADLGKERQSEQKKVQDSEKKLLEDQKKHQREVSSLMSQQRMASISRRLTPIFEEDSIQEVKYDFFISHAWEDKKDFVGGLVKELEGRGLKIWYDGFSLKVGDSLRQSIDKGLRESRFGIVVLSTAFFKKGWTNYELNGMMTKEMNGGKVVLPIWHKVSKDEVAHYSQSLADKVALNTAIYSVSEIVDQLAQTVED